MFVHFVETIHAQVVHQAVEQAVTPALGGIGRYIFWSLRLVLREGGVSAQCRNEK